MKPAKRVAIVHAFFALFAVALIVRAGQVQVIEGKAWAARAMRQHFFASSTSAPRGEILDASGNTLVENREMRRVAVALPEIRDTAFVIRALNRARVDVDAVHAAIARRRRWIDLPGLYTTSDLSSVSKLNGIHLTPVLQRVYARSGGIRRIVGTVDSRGNPVDGLE
ncbi:MAG: hypothetical protein ACJ77S_14440, partial [Gemmatimonadaceae bacterium]